MFKSNQTPDKLTIKKMLLAGIRFSDLTPQQLIDLMEDTDVTTVFFSEIQNEAIRRLIHDQAPTRKTD